MIELDKLKENLDDLEFQKALDRLMEKSEFNLSLDRDDPNKYILKMPIIYGEDHETKMVTVATFEFLTIYKNFAELVVSLKELSTVELVSTVAEIGRFIKQQMIDRI